MTIDQAVMILTAVGGVATTFLSLFVGARISASERRIMREIAATYLPRELADEKFRYYDYRLGVAPTPQAPRRQLAEDDV